MSSPFPFAKIQVVKKGIVIIFLVLLGLIGYFYLDFQLENGKRPVSPLGRLKKEPGPLEKYSFEALRERELVGSQIKLERVIKEEEKYTAYLFSFESEGKKVTGQANLPKKAGKFPVVVMLRGYADDKIYFTGLGTRKAAGVFAENGFITLAPDFLGFGSSDTSSADILEARFERPVTILNLLSSIKTLEKANPEKIVLWGHSNGGQIALSVLEITKRAIPTTLWAPVTRGFPESVLNYIDDDDELDELGLKVKKRIDDFLDSYEPERFSITTYFANIIAPLQVHQGTGDPLVPVSWSDEFVERMNNLGKEVLYFTYKGDDHNLARNWDLVVSRDIAFFKENL